MDRKLDSRHPAHFPPPEPRSRRRYVADPVNDGQSYFWAISFRCQQGLRRDNAGDLGKSLSSQRLGPYGQSPTLIVIEAHLPATALFSEHPILLAKIFNDLQLALVHPPGDGDQQKPEWVEHSLRIQNPTSRPPSRSAEISHLYADPGFGPYEE